jgi:FAD/FMN-containing dehydrogenase
VPPSPSSPFGCTFTAPCAKGVAVLTERLSRVLRVDTANRRLRVQAGMHVGALLAAAKQNGWSPPIGAPTTFNGLTIGAGLGGWHRLGQ